MQIFSIDKSKCATNSKSRADIEKVSETNLSFKLIQNVLSHVELEIHVVVVLHKLL